MDGNGDLCEERRTGRHGSAMERQGSVSNIRKDEGEGQEGGLPFERQSALHPFNACTPL